MVGGISLDRSPVESGYGPGYHRIGTHLRIKPFKQKRHIDHEFVRVFGIGAATLLDKGWGLSEISEEAYDLSASKFSRATPCYSEREMRELMLAGAKATTEFLAITGRDCRGYSHTEAYEELNMSTASGPLFKRPIKRDAAAHFMEDTGMQLEAWLQATFDLLLEGRDCPIYGTAPKEEIRPAEKVLSKSTRNTMGSPIDRSYHGLRLFGHVARRFYDNHRLPHSPHVVGHSKFNRGWHTVIIGRLKRFERGYSIDYEKFEASVNVVIITLFGQFLHEACGSESPEHHTRIQNYLRHLPFTTLAMANGEICRKFNCNPSGDFLTLMLATFADRVFQHLWWQRLVPQLSIYDHMATVIVGDDNTFTLSEAAHKYVTFAAIKSILAKYDIGITTECEMPRHWSELDFLSHDTRCVDGLYVPVPNADKLTASMAYVRASATDAIKLARAAAFYIEAFYHPEAHRFRLYRDRLCERFQRDSSSDMCIARSLCWPDYRIHNLYSLPAHKVITEGVYNSPESVSFVRQSAMPPKSCPPQKKKPSKAKPRPKPAQVVPKRLVGNVKSVPRPVPDKLAGFSPWMKIAATHHHNRVLLAMLNVYQLLGISNPMVNINGTAFQILTQNSRFTVRTPGVSGSTARLDMVVYPSLTTPLYVSDNSQTLGNTAAAIMEFSESSVADNCLVSGLYDPTVSQRCIQPPNTLSQTLGFPVSLLPLVGEPAYQVAPVVDPSNGRYYTPISYVYTSGAGASFNLDWTVQSGGGLPTVVAEYRSTAGVWTVACTATRGAPNAFANVAASFTGVRLRLTNSSGAGAVVTSALSLRVTTAGVDEIGAPKSWLGYTAKPALVAMARTLNVTSEGSDVPVVFLGRSGWISRCEGSTIQAGQFIATQIRATSLDQISVDQDDISEKPGCRQIALVEGTTFVIKPYDFHRYGTPTGFADPREDLMETYQSFVTCDRGTAFTVRLLTCIGVAVNNNVLGGSSAIEPFSLIDMQNAFNVVSALPNVLPNDNHIEHWARWVNVMLKRLGPLAAGYGKGAEAAVRVASQIATMLS